MLKLSVDTRALERRLNSVASSQLPFAVALGINDVAGQISSAEQASLEADLDRPTPFTKRGLTVQRASKRQLVGVVGFKRIQAEYLALQATGGTRRAKSRAVVVPVKARLNRFGNMPKGQIKRAIARPDTFSGKVKGVAGVWQRPKVKGKPLTLVAVYKPRVQYSARLRFVARAHDLASREIAPAIARRLRQAVKTAR